MNGKRSQRLTTDVLVSSVSRDRCLTWVNRVGLAQCQLLPVLPGQRRSRGRAAAFEKCQYLTYRYMAAACARRWLNQKRLCLDFGHEMNGTR
jgi:hypothetical protein